MKNLTAIIWCTLIALPAGAKDLKKVTTYIGSNPSNTDNGFIKCLATSGLQAAYGQDRSVFSYSTVEPLDGTASAPSTVALVFITQDKTGSRKILKALITSTDSVKHWQLVQGRDGEIFFYSKTVSPSATLTEEDATTEIIKFDISACQQPI